ncbi:unnamed protein product [Nyctereutes procyonoides]|uniref:Transmembrane protein 254 n=1 Tax=Nyctereutes procyonoides TaxID=34880 RepID=A0A811ZZ34_NYCPR|nr:unnamed protein product [Nyctereutes procyonoides]
MGTVAGGKACFQRGIFLWLLHSLGALSPIALWLVNHHHTLLHNRHWLSKGIMNGQAQLLWFLQTFLFGTASLSILNVTD